MKTDPQIPIQQKPAPKLWLYSNGQDLAWCASAQEYRKIHGGTFCYRAAHDETITIPTGWEAIGGGLADTFIQRKRTGNNNARFFAGLQKALSEIQD